MPGTAALGACHETAVQAVALWCGAVNAGTASGVMTCQSVTNLVAAGDGSVTFKWQRRTTDPAGNNTSSTVSGQTLPGCEAYGWEYFEPLVGAFIAAAVAVACARWVYRFFLADRETV